MSYIYILFGIIWIYIYMIFFMTCILWYDIHASNIWYMTGIYDMVHTLGVGCFDKSRRHKSHREEKFGPKMARWGKLLCSWDWMIHRMEAPKKRHWFDTLHLLDFKNMYIYIYIYTGTQQFKKRVRWVSTGQHSCVRICPRHSHRAEKLIEFGTQRINMTKCVFVGLASSRNYGVILCPQGFWTTAPTAPTPIWMETTVLERHPLHSSHFILLTPWCPSSPVTFR